MFLYEQSPLDKNFLVYFLGVARRPLILGNRLVRHQQAEPVGLPLFSQ